MGQSLSLKVVSPAGQRFSCASCTRCCRDLVVHLFASDVARIDQQNWGDTLGKEPYIKLGKARVLNKYDDGACVFLDSAGKCMIHVKFGYEAKPLACRLYPFTLRRFEDGWRSGIRFDCPSVVRSQGRPLAQYHNDLEPIVRGVASATPEENGVVELQKGLVATREEHETVIQAMDQWMGGAKAPVKEFEHRLRCAAFVTDMLCRATLRKVRGSRFIELVELLFSGAAMELETLPAEAGSAQQRTLLRQLAYAYGQTSTLAQKRAGLLGKARLIRRQLADSHRYRRGQGLVPLDQAVTPADSPAKVTETTFETVETVGAATGEEADAIAELLTRYIRSRLQSGTVGGSGYYGWPLFDGLQALWLAVIVIAWRARLSAAASHRHRLCFEDVVSATRRVDRAAGRIPILGTATERLRTRHLTRNGGFQRLLTSYPLIATLKASDKEA